MITIDQLLESVDLDFEPRFITKSKTGYISIWRKKPGEGIFIVLGKLRISEFENKPWTECIYEVPRKTTGKIEKIHIPDTDEVAESAMYSKELAKRLNQVIDAVNKHADIIQQIGQWGNSKGECLWCETLTKFEPNELKGAKNE